MKTNNIEREISDTKNSILNNLNLLEKEATKQINSHPLLVTGAFMTSGFIVGNALLSKKEDSKETTTPSRPKQSFDPKEEQVWRPGNDTLQLKEDTSNKKKASEAWQNLKREFNPEIKLLKQIAIGATIHFVQKKIRNSNPQISSYLNEVLSGVHKNINEQAADAWPYSSEGSKL
jgi:hypothetical protein